MTRSGCVVILVGVVPAIGASLSARAASCGEASCLPSQGAYITHFTGPNCSGTESYSLPYNGYGYSCRSWDGGAVSGTAPGTDPASHRSIVEQLKIEVRLPEGLQINPSEVCQ